MVIAKDLTLAYSRNSGIHSISLDIKRGESKVIMGPSGSGKTTLLRSLCFLEFPQKGIIEIDGISYTFPMEHPNKLRFPYPKITIVFQQLFLWPHLSNRQNLELPLRTERQKNVLSSLITQLDISPFLDNFPNQSSLGQQQRIAIARALALCPNYLLLDEATSALDSDLINTVANILADSKKKGLGILAVTHDHKFAKLLNAPVYRLENGKFLD
jgi:ABC-type polar amino acid transport system ATPase subunit